MSKTIEVVFDGKAFVPVEPVELAAGVRMLITLPLPHRPETKGWKRSVSFAVTGHRCRGPLPRKLSDVRGISRDSVGCGRDPR